MRLTRLGAILLLLILATPLAAQVGPAPAPPLRVTLPSAVLGEQRSVQIRVPAAYARTATRYPVLYLTDGDAQLTHTAATVEFLARNARIPEMIVVAISNTDRTRDLTPTKGGLPNVRTMPTAGGADRFLAFIEQELIPYVEKNYRTLPYRVFAGHSFGGLFAIHSLYARPDLFQARIAVSPTLTWDDNLVEKRFEDFARNHPDAKSTLYFSVGEEGEALNRAYDRFRKLLAKRAPKGVTWDSVYLTGEDHGSVVLLTHYHGLRKIFDGWQFPFAADGSAPELAAVEEHFSKLSQRLGLQIQAPENTVNLVGYRQLTAGNSDRAIAAFKRNVELYPDSANVYDSLGEALEKSGRIDLAAESYARAAELGKKNGDPNTEVFEQNAARARQTLGK
jgi:hypothetical protein